jgi:hypothetical protein
MLIVFGAISTTGIDVGMGVDPLMVAVASIGGGRIVLIGVADGGGMGVAVGGSEEVGEGMGIAVAVAVAVGHGVRVAVAAGFDASSSTAVGTSCVGVGGSGVGDGMGVAVGGCVGSGTVGTRVGNTKMALGSPLAKIAPVKVPKTTSTRAENNTQLRRATLSPLYAGHRSTRWPPMECHRLHLPSF